MRPWHDVRRRRILPDQLHFLLIASGRRKDFPGAEIVQQGVAADRAGMPDSQQRLHLGRTGEILPSARTNEQEMVLIRKEPAPPNIVPMGAMK